MADASNNSTLHNMTKWSRGGYPGYDAAFSSLLIFLRNFNIVYTIISVVGIIGNLFCIVVLLSHIPLRRKQANYFFVSQSTIDLLASIMLLLTMNVNAYQVTIVGPLYAILCYVWVSRSLFLGLFLASLFNITALTVERYFKTVHPVQHRIWMTKKRLIVIIVIVAVSGVLLKLPYAIGGTSIDHNGTCLFQSYPSETVSVVIGIYNFVVEYFLPLLIIAFCYVQMARSLRRNTRPPPPTAPAAPAAPTRETAMARARRNVLKTLLIVVLVFIVCTTVKQGLVLAKVIGHVPLDYAGIPFNVSQVLSFMVCCTNPFVYLVHYQEFKVGMRAMFTRKSKAIRPGTEKSCVHPEATLEDVTL